MQSRLPLRRACSHPHPIQFYQTLEYALRAQLPLGESPVRSQKCPLAPTQLPSPRAGLMGRSRDRLKSRLQVSARRRPLASKLGNEGWVSWRLAQMPTTVPLAVFVAVSCGSVQLLLWPSIGTDRATQQARAYFARLAPLHLIDPSSGTAASTLSDIHFSPPGSWPCSGSG